MADERFYRVSLRFDPESERFIAGIPELDVEAKGDSRADALGALEDELEQRFERAAVQGEDLPPPLDAEPPPLQLELTLAPTLARELQHRASRAQMDVEALAMQLIAHGLGSAPGPRRSSPPRRAESTDSEAETQPPAPAPATKRNKGRRRRSEGYRPDIDDQANFLAYVRDMEKGGRRRG